MEIQKITPKIEHSKQRSQIFSNNINGAGTNVAQTSFTGAADTLYSIPAVFLRFLDTNQAWGANLVDLGSMVIPRTAYDMTHRGIPTGMETLRRESTGTANHASVGLYGTAAGALLAMALNNKYGIKAHKIFANNDTLNILGKYWYDSLHSGAKEPLKEYLESVVSNIKVYNPTKAIDNEGLVSIGKDTQEKVVEKLYKLISNADTKDTIKDADVDYIRRLITANTGGEKSVVLNGFHNGQPLRADNTLSTLIENIHNVTKAFNKKEVLNSFITASGFDKVEILKSLKRLNIGRSIAGLGIAASIGMSVQPINMYLTKKKTGID